MAKRYNTKKIANTPALKKALAKFLSENIKCEKSISDILLYGHRGMIQHSEADLCKMFDKEYQEYIKRMNDQAEKTKKYSGYELKHQEGILELMKIKLKQFDEIADLIFEEKVLK